MSVFALVDCNNFYASCEKLFRPDLANTPVVVLSNNDGCVVARSKEAKALGIKMGVPVFQIKQQMRHHGIVAFSSNYALYADISSRVMRTLEEMAPQVEVYSIDEAFLALTGIDATCSFTDFGTQIKQRILQWIGIHVCVGIAPTKTLAKLANHAAKQYPATQGVVDLTDKHRQQRLLALMPVDEVWGVGRRLGKQLKHMGITTALDLANASASTIRSRFSVVLERTVRELNGEACIAFEQVPATKQQIICSRSFSEKIMAIEPMREAICLYATRAAEKLRKEQQHTKVISVFIRTSPFNPKEPQYSNLASTRLIHPTNDTREIIKHALRLLDGIWRDGFRFAKAGVMLSDFYDTRIEQFDLFNPKHNYQQSQSLMTVLDKLNKVESGKVFFAGQGVTPSWRMKREYLSPAYTTRWDALPKVT